MNIAKVTYKTEYTHKNDGIIPEKHEHSESEKKTPSFRQVMDDLRAARTSASLVSQSNADSAFRDMRLPGDYIGSFKLTNLVAADSIRNAQGTAAGFGKSGNTVIRKNTVDKTSKLYEQALELESYFVKIMIDSMRGTLSGKTLAGDESFAGKMYRDMMYEELGRNVTKNAGFGLADQIYLELSDK